MAKPTGERIAHLESVSDQHAKQLDALWNRTRENERLAAERINPNVESLLKWRRRQEERWQWLTRMAFFAGLLIAAELASGAWGRILRALAGRF